METVKLYYENAFLQDFTAVVESCGAVKGGFAVVLDRTAFYPEGGGQGADLLFFQPQHRFLLVGFGLGGIPGPGQILQLDLLLFGLGLVFQVLDFFLGQQFGGVHFRNELLLDFAQLVLDGIHLDQQHLVFVPELLQFFILVLFIDDDGVFRTLAVQELDGFVIQHQETVLFDQMAFQFVLIPFDLFADGFIGNPFLFGVIFDGDHGGHPSICCRFPEQEENR